MVDLIGAGFGAGTRSRKTIALLALGAVACAGFAGCARGVSGQVSERPERPERPDLVMELSASDSALPAGETLTVSVTVRNDGEGFSPATTLRYHQSTDATITTADTEIGTGAVGALPPSASSDGSMELRVPSPIGVYYYTACVDAVSGESDTANNCSASVPVAVAARQSTEGAEGQTTVENQSTGGNSPLGAPDLRAEGLGWNAVDGMADEVVMSVRVWNDGDSASTPTTLVFIRWHLSTREYPEPTTLRTDLGSVEVAALDAMESSYKSLQITGPADPGRHVFSACVDTIASEAVTTNNCASLGRIKVGAAGFPGLVPDLSVWLPPVRDDRPIKTVRLVAGEQFTLEAGVFNHGIASSPETTLRYLQSTDETISPTDIEVGSAIAKALDIVEGVALEATLTAPSTADTYYYGACVDAVADEPDATDNCSQAMRVIVTE